MARDVKGRRSPSLPAKQRGEETRRRIIDAAMELWAIRGSRGTGLAEVAERAGVGHPGLLHHFGSKDNLRLAVVKERDRQDLQRVDAFIGTGGLDTIRALPEVARSADERPGLAQLYLVLMAENLDPGSSVHEWFVERLLALRRLLSRNLARGIERGEFDERVDCDLLAARIMAFMDGAEIQRLLDPDHTDLVALYIDFSGGLIHEIDGAARVLNPTAAAASPSENLVPAGDEIAGWIERIVARGVRRPGYDADRWAEQWTADQFRSFGLDGVACEPVELPMWVPMAAASLDVWPSSDPGAAVQMPGLALPHSRPVPDGIEAELALLSPGSESRSLAGMLAVVELELIRMPVAELRGRATVTFDPDGDFDEAVQILPFGTSFMEVMEPAVDAGAVGFVGALTGVPWETFDYYVPYDGLERPMPGLWISPSSGRRLVAMLERGPVRARMTTSARRHATTTHNVVASLSGVSDDWIVVASHHDGPWASAVEDASGTALVLAQARYWSSVPERQRPHNMLFLLTSGHMAGAAGTKAFIDRHRDLLPQIVLELHLEHAARHCEATDGRLVPTDLPEPRWWFTTRHPRLESLVADAIRSEDLRRSLVLPPDVFFDSPPTDGSAFHTEGVPIVQFLTAPMYLFDSQDTLDKIHAESLVPLTRAVARMIAATRGASAETFRSEPMGG